MKMHYAPIILMISIFSSQFILAKNMDLEWRGMSCWFDALMHCLSEYDEMNQFLRDKYSSEPLSPEVLASLETMGKIQKEQLIEQNFARIYVTLVDRIHDKGSGKSQKENSILKKNDQILGALTQIYFINSLGEFGKGNDPLAFYPDFFNRIIKSIGDQQDILGITLRLKSTGKVFVPLMRILKKDEGNDQTEALERLAQYSETLSRIALFPDRNDLAPLYKIEERIVVKQKNYKLFAIMWGWMNDGHIWAYVRSKKDNCWYCYNSLGEKPAYFISEDQIELTHGMRFGKNMKPYICFYKLDEPSELQIKLLELKKFLQELKEKLSLLKDKLGALNTKFGAKA